MGDVERKKRVPLHSEVKINHLYTAEGLDISEDGMYIYSRHTFLPDSLIDLSISLGGEEFSLTAKVAHVQPGIGFGVKFPDMPRDIAEHFKSVLKKN
jgi:hypothetical protein